MRVLFDTNIVLDVLLKRPGWADSARAIASARARKEAWISALTVANAGYVLGRSKTARIDAALDFMLGAFSVAAVDMATLERARKLQFEDFEDAIQYAAAERVRVRRLITRNAGDFPRQGPIVVLSPEDHLQSLPVRKR
jgi:predicted nucleic acid-binding protein